MQNFDTQLFYAINNLAQHSVFWDQILILASRASITTFSLVLVYYLFKNRKIFWAGFLSAILSRGILTELIRFLYHRPRPFVALDEVKYLDDGNLIFALKENAPSFPSGHAALMFAIAFAIYLSDKKIGGILIVAAFLLSLARIYIGVHYPGDILGGIAVAAAGVWIVKKIAKSRL